MVNKNRRTAILSILALVMTLCLSFSMNASTVWAAEDAKSIYDNNVRLVDSIDKDNYFKELYDLALTDNSYISVMQSVVNVAKAYDNLTQSFTDAKYDRDDYNEMEKVLNTTKHYVSLTAENYLDYSSFEQKYLDRIAKEEKYLLDNYITRIEKLTEYRDSAKQALLDKKTALLYTNTANPNGSENQNVGFYDSIGKQELEDAYNEGINELDAVTLSGAYMSATKENIDTAKQNAIDKMQAVRKNNVERAYDKLQDYYAMVDGNLEGDKEKAKEETAKAIKECDPFFEGASSDILKEYSSEKKAFIDFFDENPIDDSAYKNKSVLETEDKKVKVEAFAGNKPIEIFPADAKLIVYNIVEASPKRYNAQKEILKNNDKISIAYFMDILVYYDSELWDTPKEYKGMLVNYKVTIDLNGYYENYVKNNESFLASILKNIGLGGGTPQNKADLIESAAEKYNIDLCYIYYKDGDEGAVKSLNYSLSGGTLMFDTNMLGSVAVNGNEKASLLTNPVFWVVLILALILIIVAVVLVFRFIKYSIKFYLSDGTLIAIVRARKGESFVLPVPAKKKGYVFAGWFEDAELQNRFLQTVNSGRRKITVYAKYAKELSAEQLTDYFNNICVKLASNAILDSQFETEFESLTIAKVEKTNDAIKLYLDISPDSIDKNAYGVKVVKAEDMYQSPVLKVIDTVDAYNQALELVDMLIEQYTLKESDLDVEEFSGKDLYVLTVAKPVPEGPTEEELANYLRELRKEALSYALTAENEKAEDGKILVKAFKAEDGIYVYYCMDATEENGLQEAEGDLAEGTPAMLVVTNEEEFTKAKELIETIMSEYGLEKVVDPSELGEGSSRGFGYRIKFND